jgi:hypothetical protein
MTNFCRFPPESEPASGSGVPLRTSISSADAFRPIPALRPMIQHAAAQNDCRRLRGWGKSTLSESRIRGHGAMAKALFRHEGCANPPARRNADVAAPACRDLDRIRWV